MPGMTVMGLAVGQLLGDDVFGDAVEDDDERGDGEDEAAPVVAVLRGLRVMRCVGHRAGRWLDIRLAAPLLLCRAGSGWLRVRRRSGGRRWGSWVRCLRRGEAPAAFALGAGGGFGLDVEGALFDVRLR